MKEKFLFAAALAFSTAAYAQQGNIGINTDAPKATLDVTGHADTTTPDGIIAPRIEGADLKAKSNAYGVNQKGAIVYVNSAVPSSDTATANVTAAGYYYFDGAAWQPMATASSASLGWFYMPSFNLDVTPTGTTPHTFDLYKEYVRQFTKDAANPRFASSDSGYTTATNTTLPSAHDLVFVVTDYDTNVIEDGSVSIDADGLMTYMVRTDAVVSVASYINILVKLK